MYVVFLCRQLAFMMTFGINGVTLKEGRWRVILRERKADYYSSCVYIYSTQQIGHTPSLLFPFVSFLAFAAHASRSYPWRRKSSILLRLRVEKLFLGHGLCSAAVSAALARGEVPCVISIRDRHHCVCSSCSVSKFKFSHSCFCTDGRHQGGDHRYGRRYSSATTTPVLSGTSITDELYRLGVIQYLHKSVNHGSFPPYYIITVPSFLSAASKLCLLDQFINLNNTEVAPIRTFILPCLCFLSFYNYISSVESQYSTTLFLPFTSDI
ncbi:hypothetical protein QBC38DRAFT_184932 [Podospora fimiseda]|uniref:Uncharacterized protein n=1 Tax=Podospora fimiseda TaxID=252190 RepID=A0AAN7GZB8_9PEZI|nr:hypothetical protein QBC38DRAFT_184932 [Podospora fimiseda]